MEVGQRDARSLTDAWVMPTYRRWPVTFVSGEGMRLFDDRGRSYLDFVAGVAVNALGHAHPAVAEAVARQISTLVHVSNLYYTAPMAELAERLTSLLGWDDGRVFFCNSGAEANECALKLVRRWSRCGSASQTRTGTIAALGSFHGRTFETLAATGQPAKWEPFSPLPGGFVHVPFGDAGALEAAAGPSTAAVLLEPVQGEGGVIVPPEGYLEQARAICDAHGMAFVVDEVQTGLGRTGAWFASAAARPDVITLAKALGGGLPLGACVARGDLAEAFRPGDHATTLGGGPVVCAAGLAVLDTIEQEGLVERAAQVGAHLARGLAGLVQRHEAAVDVRGRGLLLALQLSGDLAHDVVAAALERGLLVNDVSASAVRLCPPLVVSEADCDEAIGVLDDVLDAVLAGLPPSPEPEKTERR
jgi:acetylornithine/N-succinyldiaminopimelate aminotransferase